VGVYRWTVTLAHHTTGPVLCTTDQVFSFEYKRNEFTGTLLIISRFMLSAVTVVLLTSFHHSSLHYCL